MLKIGEFSQLGQVTVRTLRHYDDMGLLKPAHTDPSSDYRYYSIEQLPTLHRILALKDLGLTLDQISTMLDSDVSAEQMRRLLEESQRTIAHQIAEEQVRLARVEARLRLIEEEGTVSPYEVVLKSVPAQIVATIHRIVPHVSQMKDYRCREFEMIYAWLAQERIPPAGPELALYRAAEYDENDIDMEVGVVIPKTEAERTAYMPPEPIQIHPLPGVSEMATVTHRGDMWGIVNAIIALYRWTFANGRICVGPYRELHPHWREIDHVDFTDVIVEIQLPTAMMVG